MAGFSRATRRCDPSAADGGHHEAVRVRESTRPPTPLTLFRSPTREHSSPANGTPGVGRLRPAGVPVDKGRPPRRRKRVA
jgi:hypothetical protein